MMCVVVLLMSERKATEMIILRLVTGPYVSYRMGNKFYANECSSKMPLTD
jgi:hypothetical protein